MKIMCVGLGLIGGSMAMALEGYPDLERYAVDGDEPTRLEALGRGVVRAAWPNADDAPVEDLDIIVICLHPEAAADFVRAQAGRIRPGALLTDVCGVKRPLFEAVGEVRERTFIYLGGHPMAGRERGGFAHATADLFRGAHYILTPDAGVPPFRATAAATAFRVLVPATPSAVRPFSSWKRFTAASVLSPKLPVISAQ